MTLFDPLNRLLNSLSGSWATVIAKVESEPSIRDGFTTKFASCVRRHGVAAIDPQAFVARVDQSTLPLEEKGRNAAARAVFRHLGRIYQECLGRTEKAFVAQLQHRRAAFLTAHAQIVRAIDGEIPRVVAKAQQTYHVAVEPTLSVNAT